MRGSSFRWNDGRGRPSLAAVPPAVFTIPPHFAFADALAAGLIARHGRERTGLARGLLLVPNNRAARAILSACAMPA